MALAIRGRTGIAPDHRSVDPNHVSTAFGGHAAPLAGGRDRGVGGGTRIDPTGLSVETATYILFFLGLLGAADIAIFHSIAHGIRSHPDSAMELITHSLRGPTYAALFILIPNFTLQGMFAWLLMALFVVDVGISVWDFWLEQNSRRLLGGLPSGEYVLHVVIAMLFGALVTSVLLTIGPGLNAETRLIYAPAAVPWILRLVLLLMAILVFASGLQDAVAAIRLRRRQAPNQATAKPLGPSRAGPEPRGTTSATCAVPVWMQFALYAAGVYNLAWGSFVVLFPAALFQWANLLPINYPEVWQCVGMVVGVYGIGYLIAARDPLRHWPIVLVGLLGKVFGPLGMFLAVSNGKLPPVAAWACVTNDLIWWVPFGMILLRASAHYRRI
jgi:hypothetical protein